MKRALIRPPPSGTFSPREKAVIARGGVRDPKALKLTLTGRWPGPAGRDFTPRWGWKRTILLIQGVEARFEIVVAQRLAESLDPSEKGEMRYRL